MDPNMLKFALWAGGIIFTLVNTWALFLIKGLRDSIIAQQRRIDDNERHHISEHGKLYDAVNAAANRLDREFVHKDNLAEFKAEMRDSFKEVKELILAERIYLNQAKSEKNRP